MRYHSTAVVLLWVGAMLVAEMCGSMMAEGVVISRHGGTDSSKEKTRAILSPVVHAGLLHAPERETVSERASVGENGESNVGQGVKNGRAAGGLHEQIAMVLKNSSKPSWSLLSSVRDNRSRAKTKSIATRLRESIGPWTSKRNVEEDGDKSHTEDYGGYYGDEDRLSEEEDEEGRKMRWLRRMMRSMRRARRKVGRGLRRVLWGGSVADDEEEEDEREEEEEEAKEEEKERERTDRKKEVGYKMVVHNETTMIGRVFGRRVRRRNGDTVMIGGVGYGVKPRRVVFDGLQKAVVVEVDEEGDEEQHEEAGSQKEAVSEEKRKKRIVRAGRRRGNERKRSGEYRFNVGRKKVAADGVYLTGPGIGAKNGEKEWYDIVMSKVNESGDGERDEENEAEGEDDAHKMVRAELWCQKEHGTSGTGRLLCTCARMYEARSAGRARCGWHVVRDVGAAARHVRAWGTAREMRRGARVCRGRARRARRAAQAQSKKRKEAEKRTEAEKGKEAEKEGYAVGWECVVRLVSGREAAVKSGGEADDGRARWEARRWMLGVGSGAHADAEGLAEEGGKRGRWGRWVGWSAVAVVAAVAVGATMVMAVCVDETRREVRAFQASQRRAAALRRLPEHARAMYSRALARTSALANDA